MSFLLIKLAPGRPRLLLALLWRLGALGVETALFIAADALVRPESLENKFRCCRHSGRAAATIGSQAIGKVHQTLNFFQLRKGLRCRSILGHFQLAAQFEPL